MKIGEKIKQRRMELGMSQREISARMGYGSHTIITKIEQGKVDIPQSRIVQFAEVLGVSVAYLMGWEEVQKKNDAMTDIILRMRTDDDFLSLVESLSTLDGVKIRSVRELLSAFLQ